MRKMGAFVLRPLYRELTHEGLDTIVDRKTEVRRRVRTSGCGAWLTGLVRDGWSRTVCWTAGASAVLRLRQSTGGGTYTPGAAALHIVHLWDAP